MFGICLKNSDAAALQWRSERASAVGSNIFAVDLEQLTDFTYVLEVEMLKRIQPGY